MRLERQVDFNSFGGGVIIGRQWTFKKRIDLDVFVGPAYYMGITDEQPGTEDFKMKQFNDFEVRAGICLGVRF